MKLHDIPREIEEFEEELIEKGGELTPEMEERWAAFIAGSKEKLEAAAFVLNRIESDAETCDKEVKRLQKKHGSMQRNHERLSALTLNALKSLGGKVKTPLISMWVGRTGKQVSVEVQAGADLAAVYETRPDLVRAKHEANKDAIKSAWKAGEELPGCFIVQEHDPTESLQIR